MEKTAAILADELEKLAADLTQAAELESKRSSSSNYLAGLTQGLGLDGGGTGY